MTNSPHNESKILSWTPLMKGITTSSAWMGRPWWFKLVWVTILAEKNYKGFVDLSIPALARAAEVSIDQCREAIAWYEAPDPDSQNKEHDGRHIRAAEGGGWFVLNHFYYREMIASESRKVYKNQWAKDKRSRLNDQGKPEDTGGN